jgi:hypothetical protein
MVWAWSMWSGFAGHAVFNRAEEQYLVDNDLHSVTSVTVDGEDSWLLRIEGSTPPIGLTYRHFWHLPN